MNCLFLGYVIDKEDCFKYKGPSVAGNKYQIGILDSLFSISEATVEIFTYFPIASYPNNAEIFIKKSKKRVNKKFDTNIIPFINIQYLKQISLFLSMVFHGIRYLTKNQCDCIIYFNAFPPLSLVALFLGKIFRKKTICIVADLPIHAYKYQGIKRFLNESRIALTKRLINNSDGLIVLNENAVIEYASTKPYIVIEGGVDLEEIKYIDQKITNNSPNGKVILFYSGLLTEFNGIKTLLEAFKLIDNGNYELHIYGNGELEKLVSKEAELYENIKYHGYQKNEDILIAQRKSDILINPRPLKNGIEEVPTFPTKLLEYMCSGKPIITTPIKGINSNIMDLFYISKDDSAVELAKSIVTVSQINENIRLEKAKHVKVFVETNFCWNSYNTKIYNFIKGI